ncbi:hypothetical protein CMK18_05755 [Candidatus Poribacteria bacterium]|nr:hypothetical protein [Candidatus Poribacteria bacterium]
MSKSKSFGKNVVLESHGGIDSLYISNNLDGKTSEDVRLAFGEIKKEKVLINLGQVRLTSSRGLATLLSLMLEGEEEGVIFALCEVSEPCMIILNTMNIMEYIEGVEILDTTENAMKWLSEQG